MVLASCTTAENLQRLREAQGWTRRQVAERLEVSEALITAWETGRRKVSIEAASRLADMYAIDVETIIGSPIVSIEPQTYSVAEAATILGFSISSIYRAIERGEIRVVGIGKRKNIPRDEVDRLLGR